MTPSCEAAKAAAVMAVPILQAITRSALNDLPVMPTINTQKTK